MNCPPCMCIQSSYSNLQVVAELSNRCNSVRWFTTVSRLRITIKMDAHCLMIKKDEKTILFSVVSPLLMIDCC